MNAHTAAARSRRFAAEPTALLADDDEAQRSHLRGALARAWPQLRVVFEAARGTDAWDAYLDVCPSACFLDLRMPGLTGPEVAQRIGAHSHVVWVCDPHDKALSGFDAPDSTPGQLRLVKPFDDANVAAVASQLRAQLHKPPPDPQPLVSALLRSTRRRVPLSVVQAEVGGEPRLLRLDDVAYLQAEGRGTLGVAPEAWTAPALIQVPLKALAGQLDPHVFVQVHRTHVVNRRCIRAVHRASDGAIALEMHGRPERITVAPHFQGLFPA